MRLVFILICISFFSFQGVYGQDLNINVPEKKGNPKLASDLNDIATVPVVSGKRIAQPQPGSKTSKRVVYEISDAETASKRPPSAQKTTTAVDDGKIVVIVVPEPGQNALSIDLDGLVQIGGDLLDESEHLLEMAFPPRQLIQATTVRGVGYLRRPIESISQSVVTEGASIVGATVSQQAGVKGTGVKVAIIDAGFEGALNSYLSGELPNFTYLDLTTSANFFSGGPHGTACAEIVHDVAPEASLVLIKVSTLLTEQNAVNWCISNGVQVISHSLGAPYAGYGDGKGDASALADLAAQNEILYVDAAGNNGDGDVYNGFWTDTDADGWHNFSVGVETIELVSISVGQKINVCLVWDDWSIGFNNSISFNDYDLYLLKADIFGNWSTVASSLATQPTYSNPIESITYTAGSSGPYAIAVRKAASATSKGFRLVLSAPDLSKFTAYSSNISSIIPPSDAYGALSVGAVAWNSNAIEGFSSQGPTLDGRVKPDIAAPDGVTTSTYAYGSLGFLGTSAATPHVAGAAALVKSANPQYTRTQLANALVASVVDLGAAGKDNVFGYGKLTLAQPATRLVVTQYPATTVNGLTMGSLVVSARNDNNVVDVNFNEFLTVSRGSGGGTLQHQCRTG
jgi:subtilisin family serine protease